jgi:Peptidase family S49
MTPPPLCVFIYYFTSIIQVAQGRVWTGRQALEHGLVDHIGGLHKALKIAVELSDLPPEWLGAGPMSGVRVQTFKEPRSGLPFPFGGASARSPLEFLGSLLGMKSEEVSLGSLPRSPFGFGGAATDDILAVCDDSVACTGLVSAQTLGVGPAVTALGLSPSLAYNLAHSNIAPAILTVLKNMNSVTASNEGDN